MSRFHRALILLAVVVGGAVALWPNSPPTDAMLISVLARNHGALTQVGNVLLAAGPGARIDLSGEGSIRDPTMMAALRAAGIQLAIHDPELQAAVFETYGAGIAISGATYGLIYAPGLQDLPVRAILVEDLTAGFAAAIARQPPHRALKALVVRRVDADWWLFVDTY